MDKLNKQFVLDYFQKQFKHNDQNCFWKKEESEWLISLMKKDMMADRFTDSIRECFDAIANIMTIALRKKLFNKHKILSAVAYCLDCNSSPMHEVINIGKAPFSGDSLYLCEKCYLVSKREMYGHAKITGND